MNALIFLWLQSQEFYKNLQKQAIEPFSVIDNSKIWADIGCSTGLMSRLAHQLNYRVIGYDINYFSIKLARFLAYNHSNIEYKQEDLNNINTQFDILSATSLLSVVEKKEETLNKLISLLKDDASTLIIIEPTKHLSVKNVLKLVCNFKMFWFYKGLLLWAKAREGKYVEEVIFDNSKNVTISRKYCLDEMICITYIQKR